MRREFFCRFREINSSKGKVMCSKIPPLFVSNTPFFFFCGHQKIVNFRKFFIQFFEIFKVFFVWIVGSCVVCEEALLLPPHSQRENKRERTLEILLKKRDSHWTPPKLRNRNWGFSLFVVDHHFTSSSLSNPNVGGEDDERGTSSSSPSARTVSHVSANVFYGSEYDEWRRR